MTTAQTHEDTLTSSRALKKREDFTSWKQKMQMIALAKCDGYPRIFFNDGMTPAGQAEYTGLTATNRRKWDVACTTIFGEIGKHIEDSTLLRLWSDTYAIVMAGNPLLVPHVVALCMVALESECLRDNDTAKLIASKELDIALNSFIADDGFTAFADRVATAHTKCQRLGMPLTDLKTRFFTGFRCSATASWTTLIEIWQSGVLTFDEIMQRGRDHQASLDLEKTTATASGVAAHLGARGKGGKGGRGKGGKGGGRGRGRGNHQGAYWASHNKGGKGGKYGGKKSGKNSKGRGRGGGGRGNGRGGGGNFQGNCNRCGIYGHRAADCRVNLGGDANVGAANNAVVNNNNNNNNNNAGSGNNNNNNNNGNGNGNGNGQILVVGGMASVVDGLPTITTALFWTIELALFALVHLMMSKFSGGADLSTMVLVFVAPIITYGHMKVQNGYSARQIRVNSVLKGLLGTTSMDAILDTGASAHVTNTMSYMSNATADNSFSLVGVNGADSQMTCSYAGYLNIYLSAKTFNGRSIVVNINGEQNDGSRRNAHLAPSSPVTLVSWDQLLERGWRMAEDSSYIFHRSIEAKVYLTRRNGLFYLPICIEPRTQAPLVTAGAVRAVSGSKSSSTSNCPLMSPASVCTSEDTHARYPALTTFTLETSLLGVLHDADGDTVELMHNACDESSFAGSANVPKATVTAISVKMFLTVITAAGLIAGTYDIVPEQVSGDTLQFTMNCTNETGGHIALNATATNVGVVGAYKVKVPGLRKSTKFPSAMKWYATFGGPHLPKLRKTAELTGIKLHGDIPYMIREFQMAKQQRQFPRKAPMDVSSLEFFDVVTVDMIGKFKVPSLGGAVYCHDFVERKSKMRWAYPVKRADTETFIEAFRDLMAFVGKRPKILRVDAGSNYTSDEVKKFCSQLGIQIQTAVVKAPHQIAQGERTHGVLMSTTRAIMHFAYARYELWALGIKYSAVLNNHMAVDYTSHDDAHVPWMSLSSSLDYEHLYIFGCLVIMHQGKDEVNDGKLDPRGVAGCFVGWGLQDGRKAILVYTESPVLVRASCFFSVDETYFPLRPDGQRRLLSDGTFGSEGETASIFSKSSTHDPKAYMPEDEAIVTEPTADAAARGAEPNARGEETDSQSEDDGAVASPNGASATANDGERTGADSETTVGATLRETEIHPHKWLKRGARILFYFDQGKFAGTYQGPSRNKRDARNDLCRVKWDDGTNWEVQLSNDRMFRGDDVSKLNCGEWANVGTSETAGEYAHVAEAILDIKIFQREYDYEGDGEDRRLFIPACAANATGDDGPFDVREAQRRDDWPKFDEAIESEIQNLKSHGTWVLVDESEAINQGAYIYPCRFVLVRKRNGRYKARWVLRGDHQIFDEPDLDDEDEEDDFEDNGDYKAEDTHEFATTEDTHEFATTPRSTDPPPPEHMVNAAVSDDRGVGIRAGSGGCPPVSPGCKTFVSEHSSASEKVSPLEQVADVADGDETEHDGAVREATDADTCVDAFNTAFAGLSEKVKNTYRQLFSPVLTTMSLMMLFATATANDRTLFLADVTGAFLLAPLLPEEVVFARPPKGYENHPEFKGKILRLVKSLYGLKQAPRRWYEHMRKVLFSHGMKTLACEKCMFTLNLPSGLDVKAGTHVDDFLFSVNDAKLFEAWFETIRTDLNIEALEKVTRTGSDYMAIEVSHNSNYLFLSQRRYIEKALVRYGLQECKPADTPVATGIKFSAADMPEQADSRRVSTYRGMIGVLNWVARMTCPELTYGVSYFSQWMHNPSEGMLKGVVRMFRYLKFIVLNNCEGVYAYRSRNPFPGVIKAAKNQLYGYIDATYLSEEMSKSRYGYVFFVNGMPICWKSAKLPRVVLSIAEAEYSGLSWGARDAIYCRILLAALGFKQDGPTQIGQDNKAAIQIAENPGQHASKVKHAMADLHWVQEQIEFETIALVSVKGCDMIADPMTKALAYNATPNCNGFASHIQVLRGQKMPTMAKPSKRKVTYNGDGEVVE